MIGLRGGAAGDETHAADQRLLVAEAEPTLGFVLVVEPLGEIEQAGLVERTPSGDAARSCRSSGPGSTSARRGSHRSGLGEPGRAPAPCAASSVTSVHQRRAGEPGRPATSGDDVRAHQVDDVVGDEHTERREGRRGLRDEDSVRCRAPSAIAHACTGAVAAVGDERERARGRRRAPASTRRVAFAMFALTMRSMPHAASTTSRPSGSATSRSIAAHAASRSSSCGRPRIRRRGGTRAPRRHR